MRNCIKYILIIGLANELLFSTLTSAAEIIDSPLSVYNSALENDPELRAAWHSLLAKREKGEQSSGALLPSVVLSGKVAANSEDVEFSTGATGTPGDSSFSSHDLTLTVKQPLYRKDIFSNIDITRANTLVAETEFKTTQQNLTTRVMQRYMNALGAQDKLEFATAETRAIKEQLLYTQKRLDVGRSTSTDYLEAKAAYDLSSAEEIAAQDQLDDAIDAITEIIGQPPGRLAVLKSTFEPVTPQPENLDYWINTAVSNNPGIVAAQYQLDATTYEVDHDKAGHYPKLDLVARYSNQETGGRFGESQTDDSSIALQLEVPLYSGGQVSSRVRESINQVESSKEVLLKTQRNVQRETRMAYRNMISAIDRTRAFKQAVESTKEALSSITSGFKAGIRNNADVLDSQRELYKARQEYSAARYMYILNYVQLKNSAGVLSDEDIKQINAWFN